MKQYDKALQVFQQAGTLATEGRHQAVNHFWLALTYHQLGQPAQARKALNEAVKAMNSSFPGPDEDLPWWAAIEFVECRFLRREAEALILSQGG